MAFVFQRRAGGLSLATHMHNSLTSVTPTPRKGRVARRNDRLKNTESFSLRDLPIFANVDEETLSQLVLEAKIESYSPGATIYRQDDPAAAIILIISGYVKILRIAPNGDETLIAIRTDGEALIEPCTEATELYGVSAETIGHATLVKISATRFGRLIRESASLNLAVMKDAKQKMSALVYEIEALKSQNADQRLAHFLLKLCPSGEERCRFRLPYDKRLIAAQLGVKQETLSRAFAKLREIGVRTETRDILVESVSRLQNQCELSTSGQGLPPRRTEPLSRDNAA